MIKKSISNNSIQHKSFIGTSFKCQIVLFDPYIGLKQVISLRARVDLRAIAMKKQSTFPKAPGLEPHHQIQFTVIYRRIFERPYLLSEIHSVYSTKALVAWAGTKLKYLYIQGELKMFAIFLSSKSVGSKYKYELTEIDR